MERHWMQKMFATAAGEYVRLNRLLTFGMDDRWREAAADAVGAVESGSSAARRVLDICTGTGDLALKLARRSRARTVHGLDQSPEMLAIARRRAAASGLTNLVLTEGDCTRMPFEDGSFDAVTVSFGLRNLAHSRENLAAALGEVRRVLTGRGRFIAVETSQPPNKYFRNGFHFYASKVLPLLAGAFSGNKEPYAYLSGSMVRFFSKEELEAVMLGAGFRLESSRPFLMGAVLLTVFSKV